MMMPPAQPVAAPVSGPSLRDIHLPPEPSWWPPAPGWWLLAGLLMLALLGAIWLWRKHRRAQQQRRQVLHELDRLVMQHQRDGDQAALASGLHQLLRRVARKHDALAAQQRGEAWRQTLARMPVDAVTLGRLLALDQQIYRPPSSFDHAAAVTAVRQWLRLALKPATWKRTAQEHAHA
jgi:ABC-type nickel/cobalt efflux system permease component RcnA